MFSPPRILRAAQDDKKGGNDPASTTNDKLVKYLYVRHIKIALKCVAIRSKGKSYLCSLRMTTEVQRRSGAPSVIDRRRRRPEPVEGEAEEPALSKAEGKNLSSYPFANGYEFRFLGLRLEMTIERLVPTNDKPHKLLHIRYVTRFRDSFATRTVGFHSRPIISFR